MHQARRHQNPKNTTDLCRIDYACCLRLGSDGSEETTGMREGARSASGTMFRLASRAMQWKKSRRRSRTRKSGRAVQLQVCSLYLHTIDTEIKAKRNNMISEFVTFRITKAKAKAKFGVKYLCGHECDRSAAQLISIRKRKRRNMFGN